jgi:hypothetical protein
MKYLERDELVINLNFLGQKVGTNCGLVSRIELLLHITIRRNQEDGEMNSRKTPTEPEGRFCRHYRIIEPMKHAK